MAMNNNRSGITATTTTTANTDDLDLSSQLDSVSFSTPEERLLKQLDSSARINSVFQRPKQQPQSTAPVNTSEWNTPLRQLDSANNNIITTSAGHGDDGWGDLPPAYTAISHNSTFGFNSIIEADPSSPATASANTAVNPNSGFARFRNAPVSFTSTLQQDMQSNKNDGTTK
ncbi:hypothetical protein BDB00DRAFT_513601 [Zychaea mexicana]|uniref:uncharacterized protein n=1 Tax=Zychaea mexicana TaxID=64656 RepID=UPI0022FE1B52|nr:uncharacterized protein BDB00DRAFT_513601 [Zychaea mexicana]KAI9491099.1 hypothetical protein BDB00DRAFT_513601 [Zychaea mexicana]